MSPKQIPIRILNATGGSGLTNLLNARKYVSRGLARWRCGAIEMIRSEEDHRDLSAILSAFARNAAYDRAVQVPVGRLDDALDALKHIPVVAPMKLLYGRP